MEHESRDNEFDCAYCKDEGCEDCQPIRHCSSDRCGWYSIEANFMHRNGLTYCPECMTRQSWANQGASPDDGLTDQQREDIATIKAATGMTFEERGGRRYIFTDTPFTLYLSEHSTKDNHWTGYGCVSTVGGSSGIAWSDQDTLEKAAIELAEKYVEWLGRRLSKVGEIKPMPGGQDLPIEVVRAEDLHPDIVEKHRKD